jgi:hypothetical protein
MLSSVEYTGVGLENEEQGCGWITNSLNTEEDKFEWGKGSSSSSWLGDQLLSVEGRRDWGGELLASSYFRFCPQQAGTSTAPSVSERSAQAPTKDENNTNMSLVATGWKCWVWAVVETCAYISFLLITQMSTPDSRMHTFQCYKMYVHTIKWRGMIYNWKAVTH